MTWHLVADANRISRKVSRSIGAAWYRRSGARPSALSHKLYRRHFRLKERWIPAWRMFLSANR